MRIPERSRQTVVEVLTGTVEAHGERPFLLVGDDTVSFAALDRWSNRLARALETAGVEPRETVLLLLNDNVDFIAMWLATAKLIAVEVPVNRAYKGELLRHVVNDSGAKLIVIDREFIPALEAVQDELVTLEQIVCYPSLPDHSTLDARRAFRAHRLHHISE